MTPLDTLDGAQFAALERQLVHHEDFRLKPYKDSLGHLTVGVGHLISKGFSRRAVELIFEDDLLEAADVLKRLAPWSATLDPVRYRVLLDMAFNLGDTLGDFKATLAAVKAGDWEAAARHMLDSLWASQVGRRAQVLAQMMRTGVDPFAATHKIP